LQIDSRLRIERKGATGASSGKQGLLLMSRAATVSVCTSTLVGRGPTETRPRRSPVAFCCLLPSAYCPLPTAYSARDLGRRRVASSFGADATDLDREPGCSALPDSGF
jgi:hypothetical protein